MLLSCYFLLNYVTGMLDWEVGLWKAQALAIFFWIMLTRSELIRKAIEFYSCYFLLNYACWATLVSQQPWYRGTCYFLLNYARLHGHSCGYGKEQRTLAIFFWIMRSYPFSDKTYLPILLLFSFELCSTRVPPFEPPKKNETCYFLLNYARWE